MPTEIAAKLDVRIVTDPAEVRTLQPEWDRLHAQSPANHYGQSSSWVLRTFPVWSAKRARLCLVVARRAASSGEAPRLVGVLPLCVIPGALPWVGLSRCEPVTLQYQEVNSAVLPASDRLGILTEMIAFLVEKDAPRFDFLRFQVVDPGSELANALRAATADNDCLLLDRRISACPYIALDSTPGRLPPPSGKQLRQLRRDHRLLAESGEDFAMRDLSAAPQAWFDAMLAVYAERWREAGVQNTEYPYHEPAFRTAVHDLLAYQGPHFQARAYALFCSGRLASYVFGFQGANHFDLFNTSFDPRWAKLSPGRLLWEHALQELSKLPHVERLNFMRGEDRYKREWTSLATEAHDLVVVKARGWRRRKVLRMLGAVSA